MAANNKTIYISIADLICRIDIENPYLTVDTESNYTPPSSSVKAILHIKIVDSKIQSTIFEMKSLRFGILHYPTDGTYPLGGVSFVLKAFLEHFLLKKQIILLHGSSYIKNNGAYVFCGPSGVGKSTVINRVDPNQVLSGDTAVIKKIGKKFYVYSSPFDGNKHSILQYRRQELKKIFFLHQAKKNKFVELDKNKALPEVIKNDFLYQYLLNKKNKVEYSMSKGLPVVKTQTIKDGEIPRNLLKKIYSLCFQMVFITGFADLYFTKDITFIKDI